MAARLAVSSLSAAAASESHIIVPGGRLVHKDCVHEVPSGTAFREAGESFVFNFPNGTIATRFQCPPSNHTALSVSHGDAWMAWAQFKLDGAKSVTSLSNSWVVPKDPTTKGSQILYYWNGVEDGSNSGGTGVLQPVLEWRYSSGWGIKSWYVGAGGTVTSNLVAVKPGDKILGSMTHDGSWTVTGQAVGGAAATLKYSKETLTFTYAYEVLEAYSVDSTCSMYPPQSEGVTFTDTAIAFDGQDASDRVQWTTYSCPTGPGCAGSARCGETAKVNGNDVTISYRTGAVV